MHCGNFNAFYRGIFNAFYRYHQIIRCFLKMCHVLSRGQAWLAEVLSIKSCACNSHRTAASEQHQHMQAVVALPLLADKSSVAAVYPAEGQQQEQCSRHELSAFLRLDPKDIHMACGWLVCCPVCSGGLPCHGVGGSPAHCLGLPHHVVCQLSIALLGIPVIQDRYISKLPTVQSTTCMQNVLMVEFADLQC